MRILMRLCATVIFGCSILDTCEAAIPNGLVEVSTVQDEASKLALITGVAYVSNRSGVVPIDSSGAGDLLEATSSRYNVPFSATRVIKSESGELYVGFNYGAGGFFDLGGSELVALSDVSSPLQSWGGLRSIGFDAQLGGIGASTAPLRLSFDGSEELVPSNWLRTVEVLADGSAVGTAGIPGTAGAAAAILQEDDSIVFLTAVGDVLSARERLDGNGINFATKPGGPDLIVYGDREPIDVLSMVGLDDSENILVSESDFVILWTGQVDGYSAYYPGINPVGDEYSVPLLDYLPELDSVGFDRVVDIAAGDGQFHLLLSGPEGLWLYTAPDPTQIPEPACLSLVLCAVLAHPLRRRLQVA